MNSLAATAACRWRHGAWWPSAGLPCTAWSATSIPDASCVPPPTARRMIRWHWGRKWRACCARPARTNCSPRTPATRHSVLEVVDQVGGVQRIGGLRARLGVAVVAHLVGKLQRQLLGHAHRESEVVLVVLVLGTGFRQERVLDRCVFGEAVLGVDQA